MGESKRKKPRIRVLTLGLFCQGDMIFVAEGRDAVADKTFYRPIGGAVEFGELAADALTREVDEEIGAAIEDVRYLFTLENIFTYEGEPGHEICLVHDARFVEPQRRASDYTVVGHDDGDILYTATYKPLSFFSASDAPPLYPDGLLDRLLTGVLS